MLQRFSGCFWVGRAEFIVRAPSASSPHRGKVVLCVCMEVINLNIFFCEQDYTLPFHDYYDWRACWNDVLPKTTSLRLAPRRQVTTVHVIRVMEWQRVLKGQILLQLKWAPCCSRVAYKPYSCKRWFHLLVNSPVGALPSEDGENRQATTFFGRPSSSWFFALYSCNFRVASAYHLFLSPSSWVTY